MNQVTLEEIILDFKNKVDDSNNKYPTKLFGPNLEQVLNAAGFYKKKEWAGLTKEEVKNEVEFFFRHSYVEDPDRLFLFAQTIEAKLKERNT